MFIVIEGLDGAGTTTQAQRLVQRLRSEGRAAHLTREPSDGPVGVLIRQMLSMRVVSPSIDGGFRPVDRETLALLFAADRCDHVHSEIEPALASGKWVVSDRYYHSSLAYQGDVDGEDTFDIAWIRQLNARARKPDVTFFLQADPALCMERMKDRENVDLYESRDKLERLARRYQQVVEVLAAEGEHVVTIDASGSIDDVHSQIWKMLPP